MPVIAAVLWEQEEVCSALGLPAPLLEVSSAKGQTDTAHCCVVGAAGSLGGRLLLSASPTEANMSWFEDCFLSPFLKAVSVTVIHISSPLSPSIAPQPHHLFVSGFPRCIPACCPWGTAELTHLTLTAAARWARRGAAMGTHCQPSRQRLQSAGKLASSAH